MEQLRVGGKAAEPPAVSARNRVRCKNYGNFGHSNTARIDCDRNPRKTLIPEPRRKSSKPEEQRGFKGYRINS